MIDLHSSASPNGYRASIMLEETALAYRVHAVDLASGQHKTPAFLAINPTGRIPAIVDHGDDDDSEDGDDRRAITVTETLAIALYLSERSGRLMPADTAERARAWQWGATVVSGFGAATPGIFFARQLDAVAHEKIIAKFYQDIQNYLGAMEAQLAVSPWLAGASYSFADVLAVPTIAISLPRFGVDLAPFPAVRRWHADVVARPAVQRGLKIPP